MNTTQFHEKVSNIDHSNSNDALQDFFSNKNNTDLMRKNNAGKVDKNHAESVAKEMNALDGQKKDALKAGVAAIMNTLTVTIDGIEKKCADILAKDRKRAATANIPKLRTAAALVSLHYMIENGTPLFYEKAQEYAKQFCDAEKEAVVDFKTKTPEVKESEIKNNIVSSSGESLTHTERSNLIDKLNKATVESDIYTDMGITNAEKTNNNTYKITFSSSKTTFTTNFTEAELTDEKYKTMGESGRVFIQYDKTKNTISITDKNPQIKEFIEKTTIQNNSSITGDATILNFEEGIDYDQPTIQIGDCVIANKVPKNFIQGNKIQLAIDYEQQTYDIELQYDKDSKTLTISDRREITKTQEKIDHIEADTNIPVTIDTQKTSKETTKPTNTQTHLITEAARPSDRKEREDNIPDTIVTGAAEVEDRMRKEYLDQHITTELTAVIGQYFSQEKLENNKSQENKQIISLLKATINPEKTKGLDYAYSAGYYNTLLEELIKLTENNPTKILIPETINMNTTEGKPVFIFQKPEKTKGHHIERAEITNFRTALTQLQKNTNFLIDNTKDYIYTLSMDTVDLQKTDSETTGDYDRQLSTETSYYRAIQAERTATNKKIDAIQTQYTKDITTIQTTLATIETQRIILQSQNQPIDKLNAHITIMDLNKKLLNTELDAISHAVSIALLGGVNQSGTMDIATAIDRMTQIKQEIQKNADELTSRQEKNTETIDKHTDLKKQVQEYTDPNYTAEQKALVDSTIAVIQQAQKTLSQDQNTAYQQAQKEINTIQSQIQYRDKKLSTLDPNNPRYTDEKANYESQIQTLQGPKEKQEQIQQEIIDQIQEQINKIATQIITNNSTVQKLETEQAKIKNTTKKEAITKQITALKETNKNLDRQKAFWDTFIHDQKLYIPLSQANDELKTIVQSKEWETTINTKESNIQADIDIQITPNKEYIAKEKKSINEEKNTHNTKLTELESDISTDEEKIKTKLKEAENNTQYDLSEISDLWVKLSQAYETRQETRDLYNDTYYADQINYQRTLHDKLIQTRAHNIHTTQNITRLTNQYKAINQEIQTKEQNIQTRYTQRETITKVATNNPNYKLYQEQEGQRLAGLIVQTITELIGTDANDIVVVGNTKLTMENFRKYPQTSTKSGLYHKAQETKNTLNREKNELEKRKQTEQYESTAVQYVGIHAQNAILTQKITDYITDKTSIETQKTSYEELIGKNNTRKGVIERKIEDSNTTDNKRNSLNAEKAQLIANNKSLTEQIAILTTRINKLTSIIAQAQTKQKEMTAQMETIEYNKNTYKKTMEENQTQITIDGSTLHIPITLDQTRMTYIPYGKNTEQSTD